MKALTLWQPWASAIACGAKQIETRSWTTNYRGPIAIHASKRWNDDLAATYADLHEAFPYFDELLRAGREFLPPLPFWAVIATANLHDVLPVDSLRDELLPLELALGDYSAGRFGWVLNNVRKLQNPIPARGFQQLWEWNEVLP
jgi:hypothetical protein